MSQVPPAQQALSALTSVEANDLDSSPPAPAAACCSVLTSPPCLQDLSASSALWSQACLSEPAMRPDPVRPVCVSAVSWGPRSSAARMGDKDPIALHRWHIESSPAGFCWVGDLEFGTLCLHLTLMVQSRLKFSGVCCFISVPFSVTTSWTRLKLVSAGGFWQKEESHNKLELVMSGLSSSTNGGLADVSFWCSPARLRHRFNLYTYAIHKHFQM